MLDCTGKNWTFKAYFEAILADMMATANKELEIEDSAWDETNFAFNLLIFSAAVGFFLYIFSFYRR